MRYEKIDITDRIIGIALVSVAGMAFLWQYSVVAQHTSLTADRAVHPRVLGIAAERTGASTGVIETSLAGEPVSEALFYPETDMTPSRVNELYLAECRRSATFAELDKWTGRPYAELLRTLQQRCQ